MATPADVVLTLAILFVFAIATITGFCLPANRKDTSDD